MTARSLNDRMDTTTSNHPGPTGAHIAPNDPRLARCGFAKLQGDGIEFFVRKYEVTIGRTSKNSTLDLILGDSTTISRQHASIRYNFGTKCFELVVLGKNGVQVESCGSGATHLYTPDSPPTPLQSRDLLIMGEKRFYFLLPRSMGGQSRKRRRLEPSPAQGAVTSAAPPPSAAPSAMQGSTSGGQNLVPPHASSASGTGPQAVPAQQQATYQGPAGGVAMSQHPTSATAAKVQPQLQLRQQPQPELHGYDQLQSSHSAGGVSGMDMQRFDSLQDEDDALINAGGPPYDNGVSYGYDTGNNGFPGGF